MSYYYYGYENRSILYTLANVKYYIAPLSYKGQLPFGFQYLRSFGNYDLYQNNNPLPFGYTYETALSYSDWAQLSQIEKEEALLSSVVLDAGGSELPGPEQLYRRL